MKNVLVTGGAGFIGSNFVRHLLREEPAVKIVNLDKLTYAGSRENLIQLSDPQRHHFVQGDICDQTFVEDLMRAHEIDTIVHFAAESHVDRSIAGPAAFIQTNIVGTFSLLEAARKVWIDEKSLPLEAARFHHISTDEVYGSLGPQAPAFSETTAYAPNSPYAASKAASDYLVRAHAHTYALPVTVSNCSNNYGPYQFPEKLIPLAISNALAGNPLPLYGDGKQIRDWLYVEDHCDALSLILRSGRQGETYNIGGGNQPTNLEVVRQLCAVLDDLAPDRGPVPHDSLITFVADRPGHDRRYAMDIHKIEAQLGWRPRVNLADGLRKTAAWYLENADWVTAIRSGDDYRRWIEENYDRRGEVA
jgi:dTDP-glucose 4,6-dehydratase